MNNFYINTITNKYPYTKADLINDNPWYNVYQPLPDGVFPVVWVDCPESPDVHHEYVLETPTEKDGLWTTNWVLKERKSGTYRHGPGPWLFDEETKTWYLANPLAKATDD